MRRDDVNGEQMSEGVSVGVFEDVEDGIVRKPKVAPEEVNQAVGCHRGVCSSAVVRSPSFVDRSAFVDRID